MMPATDMDKRLAEALRRLRENDEKPVGALFDELVGYGFIDRNGRLTTLLGGEADVEPGAHPPVPDENVPV